MLLRLQNCKYAGFEFLIHWFCFILQLQVFASFVQELENDFGYWCFEPLISAFEMPWVLLRLIVKTFSMDFKD